MIDNRGVKLMMSPPRAETIDQEPLDHIRAITEGRRKIDAIDHEVVRLIRERKEVSTIIQQSRVEIGHPRLQLGREMEILKHYGIELGKVGNKVAMAILEACRGPLCLNSDDPGRSSQQQGEHNKHK